MGTMSKIVYMSEAQLQELFTNGSVTSGGVTVVYSADDLYVTPASPSAEVSVVYPSSGTSFTLQPCPVTYAFGEKAELTVTVTATSQYHFSFSSPSATATVLTMTGITGTMGDTVEAGKDYEVDIWNGIAFVKSVEVTPVT